MNAPRFQSLSFRIWVDRQLTLRICPVVDGQPLSRRFMILDEQRGLMGLALGTKDAVRYQDLAMGPRLPLLSCDCGAYDCRVLAEVSRDSQRVSWHDMKDSRTGARTPDMHFAAADYDDAVTQAAKSLRRSLAWYRFRLSMASRDDSMPYGIGSWFDLGLFGAFLIGLAADRDGYLQWAPFGAAWWLWCAAFAIINVTRDLIMRRLRGGDVWLDGPLSGVECPWHPRIRYLKLNHRRSYGIFRTLRTTPDPKAA